MKTEDWMILAGAGLLLWSMMGKGGGGAVPAMSPSPVPVGASLPVPDAVATPPSAGGPIGVSRATILPVLRDNAGVTSLSFSNGDSAIHPLEFQ
jgi:hypothetical protein